MQDWWLSLLYYFLAYIVVTVIGILHTVFNIYVLHYKPMKDSPGMGEAYEKTKPFHPLYNLIVFPLFFWFYTMSLHDVAISELILPVGLLWGTLTIVIDLFGWVIIKHPWSLSFKEFYCDYQPWITLTYIIIYLSPALAFVIIRLIYNY